MIMNLKEQIIFDYNEAKEKGQSLLKFALEDLLSLTKKKLNTFELLNSIEELIEYNGQKVIKNANKRKNIEPYVFQMILLNNYVCNHRFKKKSRQIILEYNENTLITNSYWNRDKEVIPKIIKYKKSFFNFF